MSKNVNLLDSAPDTLFKLFGATIAVLEDPTGTARPLWRDGSRYQWPYNFPVAVANGVHGIIWRAGISWGYKDATFPLFWSGAQVYPVWRTSYHVIYSDQLVTPQADSWYAQHPERDIIPRVIDLEADRGVPASQVADVTWQMSELVKSRDGVRPIIYTRYMLANSWLASWTPDMLNDHYWILAQYLWDRVREHPGPPTLPNGVNENRVILHQTADKKAGFPGEAPSAAVDYDRWELGDAANMFAFIRNTWEDPAPPPPDPEPCPCQDQIDALGARVSALEKRP